ncbi:serine/threonine protein kinase [Pseudenhygromyxa sp. WMMC2535]|uniref:protein kinase domain-containing protein n=1 Tax=Pseudenhygromyxa sp. WMMC2535 TaxID=2712867 RepID=UPI0015575B8A|nr:serine/threonine protein kinase [Pseudenhygromyxa sp. WMMC2535]
METIGAYTLLRRIGEGGMGEVWLGQRRTSVGAKKLVAIKLLARRHLEAEGLRKLFVQEARLSMKLSHSNIVQVFDVVEDGERCAMVMEWVDGLDLAQLCARMRAVGQRLSEVQSAFIIAKLLRALTYAHELDHRGRKGQIIHRDVSPQNVMLSVGGEVKLMDFGIARLSSEDSSSNLVRGKPRYMPPEQLAGSSREPTIDLFAVGAILHELLDNRKFRSQADDDGQLYGMILRGEVPPLGVAVPPELDALRRDLLAPDPRERLASAREALERLDNWSGMRDLSFQLETLVREFVDLGPRPSALAVDIPTSEADATHLAASHSESLALGDATPPPLATLTPSQPATSAHETETLDPETIAENLEASKAPKPEDSAPPPDTPPAPPTAPHPLGRALPSKPRQWTIALTLGGVFIVLLTLTLVSLARHDDTPTAPRPQPHWSPCQTAHHHQTCAELCGAVGEACVPGGCSADEQGCSSWFCAQATFGVGLSENRCMDPNMSVLATCEAPLDWTINTHARCCCAPED